MNLHNNEAGRKVTSLTAVQEQTPTLDLNNLLAGCLSHCCVLLYTIILRQFTKILGTIKISSSVDQQL